MFLTRLGYGIIYFLDLIYEILKATFDVAFNGIMRQNIDPVVVQNCFRETCFSNNFG